MLAKSLIACNETDPYALVHVFTRAELTWADDRLSAKKTELRWATVEGRGKSQAATYRHWPHLLRSSYSTTDWSTAMILIGMCSAEEGKLLNKGVFPKFTLTQPTVPEGTTKWVVRGTPGLHWSCELKRVPNTGGHKHAGGPTGKLSPKSGTIPSSGVVTGIKHKTPAVAGDIELKYKIGTTSGSVYSRAMIAGLVELPVTSAIERVGITKTHPQSHYGTQAMTAAIVSLAEKYYKKFSKPLGVNDISLIWGGLFDHKATWAAPHATHRMGVDADIRTKDMSKDQKAFLVKEAKAMKFKVLEEKDPPHHHLTLQATKPLLLKFTRRTRKSKKTSLT